MVECASEVVGGRDVPDMTQSRSVVQQISRDELETQTTSVDEDVRLATRSVDNRRVSRPRRRILGSFDGRFGQIQASISPDEGGFDETVRGQRQLISVLGR